MRPLFVITLLAAMAVSGCMTTTAQEPSLANTTSISALDLYSSEQTVTLHSKIELTQYGTKSFNEWTKIDAGYYGAFAYSLGSGRGHYGATTGHNTLKSAREYALDNCMAYLEAGPACKVIAVLTPKGFVDRNKMTLSKNITKEFRRLRTAKRYHAIATNDAGYADWATDQDTQAHANTEAMRICNLRVKRQTPRFHKIKPCHLIPEH